METEMGIWKKGEMLCQNNNEDIRWHIIWYCDQLTNFIHNNKKSLRLFSSGVRRIVMNLTPGLVNIPRKKHLRPLPGKKVRKRSWVFKSPHCPRLELGPLLHLFYLSTAHSTTTFVWCQLPLVLWSRPLFFTIIYFYSSSLFLFVLEWEEEDCAKHLYCQPDPPCVPWIPISAPKTKDY